MFQIALPATTGGGGGGSNFPYAFKVSGTLPDFTTANQEQSANTGLSEIKYIYVKGISPNGNVKGQAWFDVNRSAAKQVATYSTSSSTNAINSGTNATGIITANGAQIKISGISGGTITIKDGNSTNYAYKNVEWYAG